MKSPLCRVAQSQIPDCGRILAQALFDDPFSIYCLPNIKLRRAALEWFYTRAAAITERFGQTYLSAGGKNATALWLPPGNTKISLGQIISSGLWIAPMKLGFKPLGRFFTLISQLERQHEKAMHEEHWYLFALGVEPQFQGEGLGSALLEPILKEADTKKQSCYLETAKEKNIAFYQKHAFHVVNKAFLPKEGPQFWTMARPPQI